MISRLYSKVINTNFDKKSNGRSTYLPNDRKRTWAQCERSTKNAPLIYWSQSRCKIDRNNCKYKVSGKPQACQEAHNQSNYMGSTAFFAHDTMVVTRLNKSSTDYYTSGSNSRTWIRICYLDAQYNKDF